jgi:subtilase family serine protease
MRNLVRIRLSVAAGVLLAACAQMLAAGPNSGPPQAPAGRIARTIDERRTVTLEGNVHPLARAEFDQGAVSAGTRMERMVLLLEPSPAAQAKLDALVEAQQNPASGLYRQWLTPAEFGARFGVSEQDLAQVTAWLTGHGFSVEEIPAGRRLVVFSGTAGQVFDTFHTEIHRYLVDGVSHIANAQEPQIPAALAGVVDGVVSLHDFRRRSQIRARRLAGAEPQYTAGSTHYVFPADFAAIYDLNPLYGAGTTGSGVAIAVAGRSNINLGDVAAFRSLTGLGGNTPSVVLEGTDPGLVAGDQLESTLDVEWSGAVAPEAAVTLVAAASTGATDGVDLAAEFIVNHKTAPVVSVSYGSCEQEMGSTELAFYNSLWLQAASQGISVFVASGDAGAAGCSAGANSEGSGTAVNGLCSSPYSTCVGGTEFNEGSNAAQYWASANSASYGSALGYIPEEVWNESASNGGTGMWASGGGASVVYRQPGWQAGVSGTGAANGMRAVPDVALSSADHDGSIMVEDGSDWIVSGTSVAAPSFAGVMALVVESQGGAGQGSANAGLYRQVNAAHNPFHSTPSGNNSVPGVEGFTASGAAYNLATGLGSVDVAVLVGDWGPGGSASADFTLMASAGSGTVAAGKTVSFTVGVSESGSAENAVSLAATAPAGISVGFSSPTVVPGSAATVTVTAGSTAAAGAHTITLTGTDDSGSQTLNYALTVTQPPTLTLTAGSGSVAVVQGASNHLSLTASTGGSFLGSIAFSASGLPTGVKAAWSANPVEAASSASTNAVTLTLAASPRTPAGSFSVTITASGDGLTSTQKVKLKVEKSRECCCGPLVQGTRCDWPAPLRFVAP